MADTAHSTSPAFLAMHAVTDSDSTDEMRPYLDEARSAIALAECEAGRAALSAPVTASASSAAEAPTEPNPAAVDRITAEILLKATVRLRDFINKGAMTSTAVGRLAEIERMILDAHRKLTGGAS
ncbi:hypothetical protein [Amorphus orientalis]|uniref:Uncharacterized protein n=1 Tax=Amorphus orientalis TaxID=649198 RepID=A0AAE4AR53_9HYPH|nr:hypothetical protein [Amorphus orientalis]MDQ0314816.1 hypothetical protein [Amorphus orientalis]